MRFQFSPMMFVVLCLFTGLAHAAPDYWSEPVVAKKAVDTGPGRRLMLDVGAVRRHIDTQGEGATLAIPRPDGGYVEFALFDSGTMPPELAKRFPKIRSYRGVDADGNAVRVDISPIGFQALVFARNGTTWFVRPEDLESNSAAAVKQFDIGVHPYVASLGSGARPDDGFRCQTKDLREQKSVLAATNSPASSRILLAGSSLHTYRIAVAATSNYTTYFGGTVADGLAAITTTLNRVNEVFERDASVHLTLVSNNDRVVYTNRLLDPYWIPGGTFRDTLILVNTTTLNLVIGPANYDVGHVFDGLGEAGLASVASVCGSFKAQGASQSSLPNSETFYMRVAHEIGHQFGARHTFNSESGSCGGNRSSVSAYEPGSGSTIMGYPGACLQSDLQLGRDPYFHIDSLIRIFNFTSSATCGISAASSNTPPTIAPLTAYTIPARTPFALTASASDPDGDPLTYTWEEGDRGPATDANVDNGVGPIIRSFPPQSTGTRIVPRLAPAPPGAAVNGELLPQVARAALGFAVTVRDNHPGGGAFSYLQVPLQVVDTGAPFAVTTPNTALTWTAGSMKTVTWNVAGTTAPPIACANVNIHLSKDGGLTFPTALATGVANSGTRSITVPAGATTQARVRVQCSGNIFFDMSDVNFTIN